MWGRVRAVLLIVGLSAAVSGCGSNSSPTSTRTASRPPTATAPNQALEHHFLSCVERARWRVSTVVDQDPASELMANQPGLVTLVGVRSANGAAAALGSSPVPGTPR